MCYFISILFYTPFFSLCQNVSDYIQWKQWGIKGCYPAEAFVVRETEMHGKVQGSWRISWHEDLTTYYNSNLSEEETDPFLRTALKQFTPWDLLRRLNKNYIYQSSPSLWDHLSETLCISTSDSKAKCPSAQRYQTTRLELCQHKSYKVERTTHSHTPTALGGLVSSI